MLLRSPSVMPLLYSILLYCTEQSVPNVQIHEVGQAVTGSDMWCPHHMAFQ